ncbi:AIPR family protein [Micromonospora sp. NPDC049048]|uniref:AIPR family protein n=1 Tax=Micromonospora sp. NPDC049048 TaxID=3364263 RepID=UPI003715BC2B
MSDDLASFVELLDAEVSQRLTGETGGTTGDAFVRVVAERLIDDGALEDLDVCYSRKPWRTSRLEVSGYDISHEGTCLDIVTRHYGAAGANVPRRTVDQLLRHAANFAAACRDGLHRSLEESSPEFDMAQRIHERWADLHQIRIFLLTDGRTTIERLDDVEVAGLPASRSLWDITRLHRLATSGRRQEEIVIDLEAMGQTLPVLQAPEQADGYACLLAVLPGQLLADLYKEHHGRLLQRNVRAYLQARGSVNREIHATIRKAPGRFLAYNNGISATATHVDLTRRRDGTLELTRIRDLQIVNGGQTTASLQHAALRGDDLSDVHVMAKITVVPSTMLDELVPMISRYANSQNAIRPADFEANGRFHVGLERLSRSIWAPAPAGSMRQSRWYYERARGQYQVDRSRSQTKAQRTQFDLQNPARQRFGKTDAAKYEMTHLGKPHVVSLGAEKCFQAWTIDCELHDRAVPDARYFQHLVAKGVLFTGVRAQILAMKLGGYPGQTAAYVLALILDRLDLRLDLDAVWRSQAVPPPVTAAVPEVTRLVRSVIIDPPGSANVTEWCKKEDCWKTVQALPWEPTPALRALISTEL